MAQTLATASKIYDENGNLIDNPALLNTSSITPSSLEPVSGLPFVNPNPVFPPTVAGLDSSGQAAPLPQEQEQSDIIKRTQSLYDQLTGRAAEQTAAETAQGLPELQKVQTDLSARLKGLQNEALAIPLQLQNEAQGRGITAGGLQPLQTAALRNNAIQALSINSLLESSRGNIANAQALADKAVAAKFDPIEAQINANLQNLNLLSKDPSLTLAQQNRLQAQQALQETAKANLAKQKENASAGQALINAAMQNSQGSQEAQLAINQALGLDSTAPDYVQKVFNAVGQYQTDPQAVQKSILENRKLEADIERINADRQKTEAEKAKILAESPTGATTKAQLQNNEALTLAKQLRKSDAVGKASAVGASGAKLIPFGQALGLQGDRTAFEAKVNTLKSNLTLDNLKLLKGAMSDKDLLFLNSIGSSLDVSMSEEQFDKELDRIIKKLEGAGATAADGEVTTTPDGTQVIITD